MTGGNPSAIYTYLANSPLVDNIVFATNGTTVMTTTKGYDALNRLTNIVKSGPSFQPVSFAYAYNSANQGTAITKADNARWVYSYDSLGQVVSGKKYWSDGTPVAGQHFEYAFDDIGNRQSTKAGGDNSGANLRPASYLNNSLNQILSREVPGYVSVLGTASNNAKVTNGVINQCATAENCYVGQTTFLSAVGPYSGGCNSKRGCLPCACPAAWLPDQLLPSPIVIKW